MNAFQTANQDVAHQLWQQGLKTQLDGNVDEAMSLYERSLQLHETAEAWTFLGWGLSFQGRLKEAIEACFRAIEIDQHLGNPYNDIGAYLAEQEREDEAILWFGRAKEAGRYDTPQFPYLNLARIFIARGLLGRALLELQVAELLAPADPRVAQLIARVGELVADQQMEEYRKAG